MHPRKSLCTIMSTEDKVLLCLKRTVFFFFLEAFFLFFFFFFCFTLSKQSSILHCAYMFITRPIDAQDKLLEIDLCQF